MRFIRMRGVQRDFKLPIWAIEGLQLHRRRARKYIICMRGEGKISQSKYGGGSLTCHACGRSHLHERRENNKHGSRSQIEGLGPGLRRLGPGRESEGSGRS